MRKIVFITLFLQLIFIYSYSQKDSQNNEMKKNAHSLKAKDVKMADVGDLFFAKPVVYKIVSDKTTTNVTIAIRLTSESQLIKYSKNLTLIDSVSKKEYPFIGYENNISPDKGLVIYDCLNKIIFLTLKFSKIDSCVKTINITEKNVNGGLNYENIKLSEYSSEIINKREKNKLKDYL